MSRNYLLPAQKFKFSNFIIGESNKEAYLQALSFAKGNWSEPLAFFRGQMGLGKKHLLHAIGNGYLNRYPDRKVVVREMESFVSEVEESFLVDVADLQTFLKDYIEADIVLFHGLQYAVNRPKVKSVLEWLVNVRIHENKLTVFSVDEMWKELWSEVEKLPNKISVTIAPPDKKLAMQIIQEIMKEYNYKEEWFEKGCLEYLAENCRENVIFLQGSLHKVYSEMRVNHLEKVELDLLKELFEKEIIYTDYSMLEVINRDELPVKMYVNLKTKTIEPYEAYVNDDALLYIPTIEELYPYRQAINEFVDERDIIVSKPLEMYLREQNLLTELYDLREAVAVVRLHNWFRERKLKVANEEWKREIWTTLLKLK